MNAVWRQVMVASAVLSLGCSNDVGPEDVAGTYRAQQFTIELNGTTTNMLAQQASVDLELRADGTLSGHLTVPAIVGVQAEPIDEPITGTYAIRSGDLLILDYKSPSGYLDELNFTVDLPQLRAYVVIQRPQQSGFLTLLLRRQ